MDECSALQRILNVYEEAFGQNMNRAKTSLFFLAKILLLKFRLNLKASLRLRLFVNMRNTLVFILWLVNLGVLATKLVVGRRSFRLELVRKL